MKGSLVYTVEHVSQSVGGRFITEGCPWRTNKMFGGGVGVGVRKV